MPLYPQKCSLHPSSRKILYATGGSYILIDGKKSKGCYGAYVGLSVKILKLSLEKGESKFEHLQVSNIAIGVRLFYI